MTIAIEQTSATQRHGSGDRKPNFGALVSAINRGDIEGAQNAFDGLIELAPKAPGPLRKGALDAMEKALKEADLTEAAKALKALQQLRQAQSSDVPIVAETPGTGLASGPMISILI